MAQAGTRHEVSEDGDGLDDRHQLAHIEAIKRQLRGEHNTWERTHLYLAAGDMIKKRESERRRAEREGK